MMRIFIETFGCTFNQGDSQIMAALLKENNAQIVEDEREADIIIINTCYVKHPTEQKILNRIKKVQSKYPDKKLVVAGCMVEIDPQKLEKIASSASWVGPRQIKSITDVVESCLHGKSARIMGHGRDIKADQPKMRFNPMVHISQICEGCTGSCTYCCTRYARGALQSYPVHIIKKEVEKAVIDGCVEVQLTAQDTASYGKDIDKNLAQLINQISAIPGEYRIRIGMLHPKNIIENMDEIIEAFNHKNVYKFLHIPVQSGSDSILKDMNREHTVEEFKEIISKFRMKIPQISIATDIIVGYPTETSKDFQSTLHLIQDIKPDFLHISKYGHRPGTKASTLVEIGHKEMKKRSKLLNELKKQILLEKNLNEIGTVKEILIIEKGSKGGYIGRTDSYKPVVISKGKIGSFVTVKIDEVTSTYLKGSVI